MPYGCVERTHHTIWWCQTDISYHLVVSKGHIIAYGGVETTHHTIMVVLIETTHHTLVVSKGHIIPYGGVKRTHHTMVVSKGHIRPSGGVERTRHTIWWYQRFFNVEIPSWVGLCNSGDIMDDFGKNCN